MRKTSLTAALLVAAGSASASEPAGPAPRTQTAPRGEPAPHPGAPKEGELLLPRTTTTVRKPAPAVRSFWSDMSLGPTVGVGFPRLATAGLDFKYRDWFKLSGDYGFTPRQYPFETSSWGVAGSWFFVPVAHVSLSYGSQKTSFRKGSSGTHPIDASGNVIAFDVERKVSLEEKFVVASVGYFVPIGPYLFFECELGWYQPVGSTTSVSTNEEKIPAGFSNAAQMKQNLRDADRLISDYVRGGKPYVTLTRLHFLF